MWQTDKIKDNIGKPAIENEEMFFVVVTEK